MTFSITRLCKFGKSLFSIKREFFRAKIYSRKKVCPLNLPNGHISTNPKEKIYFRNFLLVGFFRLVTELNFNALNYAALNYIEKHYTALHITALH